MFDPANLHARLLLSVLLTSVAPAAFAQDTGPTDTQSVPAVEPAPAIQPTAAEPAPATPTIAPSQDLTPSSHIDAAPESAAAPAPSPEATVEASNCDGGETTFELGQGVKFASCDGDYALHIWQRAQARYTLNNADQPGPNTQQTMEIRRASLFFVGNAFGAHNKYFLQLVFAPRDVGLAGPAVTNSPIFDAFFTFDYLRDFSLRVGQYKPFFSRQFIAAWGDLQFVDRSIVQNEFHLDRDLGFDVFSDDIGGLGLFRYYAGLYLGQGRNSVAPRAVRVSPMARIEVMPFGKFDDYKEGDVDRSPTPKLSIGAAYAYLSDVSKANGVYGPQPADAGLTSFHEMTADLMFKLMGLSVTSEVYLRKGTRQNGGAVNATGMATPTEAARNGVGYFVQGGYLLPVLPLEIAVRGGQIFATSKTSLVDSGELGGALSYYMAGHPFKLQLDYFRTYQGSQTLADGANQLRLQLQMQM